MSKVPSKTHPHPTSVARTSGNEPAYFSTQITTARRFYLNLDADPQEPLAVITGGLEQTDPQYAIRRSTFPYITLEFVTRGTGRLILAGHEHELSPATVFTYGPGIPHEFTSSPDRPLHKYFVNFSGPLAQELLTPPAPAPGQVIQSSQPGHLVELFEELIDAGTRTSPFRARICSAILTHILLRVAETAVPAGTLHSDAYTTYCLARDYITANHLTINSLGQVADHCRVDNAYLCRLFKRFDHQGPWQTVLKLKMHTAATRLTQADVRVSDVAEAMGFADPFQFSRTFRRVMGLSPRAFIRSQQGNLG